MYTNIYCNNCGKRGHLQKQCFSPITSIGIICIKDEGDDPKYLMIRRKNTLSYVTFIRGIYDTNNIEYVKKLFNYMTLHEKKDLITKPFDTLWKELWNIESSEERKSSNAFERAKNKYNKISDRLEEIASSCDDKYEEPEWGFPKGKKKNNETNVMCAKREFEEETNLKGDQYEILDMSPLKEVFIGINGLKYMYIYYIAKIKDDPELTITNSFQKHEISDMKWLSVDEAVGKIRTYSKERIHLINYLNKKLLKKNLQN